MVPPVQVSVHAGCQSRLWGCGAALAAAVAYTLLTCATAEAHRSSGRAAVAVRGGTCGTAEEVDAASSAPELTCTLLQHDTTSIP